MPKNMFEGMSVHQWTDKNAELWLKFEKGEHFIVIPENFGHTKPEKYGMFLFCENPPMTKAPGPRFAIGKADNPAHLIMVPSSAVVGDTVRIKRESKTGKSLIGELVEVATCEGCNELWARPKGIVLRLCRKCYKPVREGKKVQECPQT